MPPRRGSDMMKLCLSKSPADCTYFAGSLNIFAMFYVIPFKVEFDADTNSLCLKTTKLRQVVCGSIHMASILLLVICGYLKCFTYGLNPKGFEFIIYALDFALCTVFTLAVVKVLWKDQILIERFIKTPSYGKSIVSRRRVLTAVSFCMLIFICDLHLNRASNVSNCSIPESDLAEKSIFIQMSLVLMNFLLSIAIFVSQLFLYIGEGLCCTLAINMWEICKNLERKLRWDTPFKQGLEIYHEHRQTVEKVNCFSSILLFTNLMSSLVYYAQAPIVYYFGHQAYSYEKSTMMAYTFITLMTWGLAGECHAQTRKTIKKWVNRQEEKADESTPAFEQFKLAAISHNLDSDPIAMSCCFFNVTYGFEASMLGLLVSYNIIIFQMGEQGNAIKASASVTQ